ncbi:D-alanyl-D-alanine carboxypeptidase [Lentilactobacillus diolivorans]|nr:D-alanyl-D-alanine carboxypeptidase [Lentilactobacillus diolivorans]GEP23689.1 hypothetical protein LDI01_12820 [Lentilactobacillus diolivorans]
MKRVIIKAMITSLTVICSAATLLVVTPTSFANSTYVSGTHQLTTASYRAVSGYLYRSPKLITKLHNADNYPLTTFYASKSVNITRSNGNRAVYYYVKNGNGKIHGWIWRGYLVRVINITQQRQQINHLVSLIDSMTTSNHNRVVSLLKKIKTHDPISTLSKEIQTISQSINNSLDLTKLSQITSIIKSDGQTMSTIFQNGLDKLYTGIVVIHHFNNRAFALAQGLLNLIH